MSTRTARIIVTIVALSGCASTVTETSLVTPMTRGHFPRPAIPFAPLTYSAPKLAAPPIIDGRIDDDAWTSAPWTSTYVDIEGDARSSPRFRTRGKIAWDDEHLYFAAELEEPHLWATYTERDSIIFHENDWEIFLDPDGDTHDYFELEINVLNTVWDLFLVKPYRDGGPALHEWDAPGLRHAVHADGTINDPSDTDRGWTIEVAWPWASLASGAGTACPPAPGDRWKVNFSRVQWRTQAIGDVYAKVQDAETGKPLAEANWVWSPQGLINMHYPEMWGIVEFAPDAAPRPPPTPSADDRDRWRLREAYYAQRAFHEAWGRFSDAVRELRIDGDDLDLNVFETGFEIILRREHGDLVIREDGHIRQIEQE